MNTLKAGFGRVNITPMMGISIAGYYIPRNADGILDELEINVLALADDSTRVLLINLDSLGIRAELSCAFRAHVAEVTGVPADAIFISATHTHTAPHLVDGSESEKVREYLRFVFHKIADAARFALEDLKPARMGFGVGEAPNIAFIRRFRMKDGSIRTNPGVNNPDILAPIGDVDERVNVLRFDREGAQTLILVNFASHPDVVGGCKISADWPGLLRATVEKTLDNTRCIFFNGAQGDVNHVNVHPRGGDLNDMFIDFDDVSRGYGHARYIARVVTGGVLQAFDKVEYVDTDRVRFAQRIVNLPSNMPKKEEVPEARRINDLHKAGRDSELPYTGMLLTTVVAEAARMVLLENGPAAFPAVLSGITVGPVALIGIPGEPFTNVGRRLKEAEGYSLILPCCCTNGYEGYFPMKEAYDEGGYEARSSRFKAGVAEQIIAEGKQLLKEMSKQI